MMMNNLKKGYIIVLLVGSMLGCILPVVKLEAEEIQYYQESLEELVNPERGLYEPAYYTMKETGNTVLNLRDNFIHLRVGIGAFSGAVNDKEDIPLSQDMLDALDATLKNIKANGGSVILRFAYDNYSGQANLEPSVDMIVQHVGQLKTVFKDNADVISYVELGFFGPWGEMHSSSACTTDNVSVVLTTMLDVLPESITVGVRTPRYYAAWADLERERLNLDITKEGTPAYRVGLYNDGYLGSESDLGTFVNREVEIAWLENQARHTFYGGEVVADYAEGAPLNTAAYLAMEGFRTHTTYLNRCWNNTVIAAWKEEMYQGDDPVYQGKSGYTYVINHLGYRFVLRQVYMSEQINQGDCLNLEMNIENVGFGNLINDKKVTLILQGENSIYEIATDMDPTGWNSNEIVEWKQEISLPSDIKLGTYSVYLRISRYGDYTTDNNYQCIQLANDGIWNETIGANYIGSFILGEKTAEEETGGETNPSTEEKAGGEETASQILVKRIKITGISKKIAAGKTIKLSAKVVPSNAENKNVIWISSNTNYATVEQNGLVKVKAEGAGRSVIIKAVATDGSGIVATYRIRIMPKAVRKLTVQVSKKQVKAGETIRIKAVAFPTKNTNSKVKYVSKNTKYATVNSKGLVKTKKDGKGKTVKIVVMTTDGSAKKKVVRIKIR